MKTVPESQPMIALNHVSKRVAPSFGLTDLCFEVAPGNTLALFGPSGCGKTTTLRLIAGFERPDAGAIEINGRTMSTPHRVFSAHRRGVGMVFQDLALWPHMTVRQHLHFVLEGCSANRREKKRRANHMLDRVGLRTNAESYPHQLSGGEKQRLALARALVIEPQVLLMDEPLTSLDASLRSSLLHDIRSLIRSSNMTSIYVTHDWHEALFLADTIAMMQNGRIEQRCAPQQAQELEENTVSLDLLRKSHG